MAFGYYRRSGLRQPRELQWLQLLFFSNCCFSKHFALILSRKCENTRTVLILREWKLISASPLRAEKEFRSDDMFKDDAVKPPACKSPSSTNAGGREQDGSSAESGDSEIELVSEEPPKAGGNPFAQPPKSKGTVSQPNNPFDSSPAAPGGCGLAGNHAPPTAYSILREEREAELDSDLFIESASEESPKREQGFGGLKQGVSPPSPLVPSVVSPRSAGEAAPAAAAVTERVKTPVKSEEDYPAKPKPPTAAVPPEIRSERPQKDDMHENASEGKGDPGKPAVSIFPGLNKQKGQLLLSISCLLSLGRRLFSAA